MISINRVLMCGFFILLFSLSCKSNSTGQDQLNSDRKTFVDESEGLSITKKAASKVNAQKFVEIEFMLGSTRLNENAIETLNSLIEQGRLMGPVDRVIVLSWADDEYPSAKIKKLSTEQRKLAELRNKAIKKYIAAISSYNVNTYNMAERPHIISRWFNTTDSQLKSSLLQAGLPTTDDELRYPSKASHAVIMVKVE